MKVVFRMDVVDFLLAPVGRLAKETGIDRAMWSKWINGNRSPSVDKLEEIAEKLGMDRVEFIEAFFARRDATIKRLAKDKGKNDSN